MEKRPTKKQTELLEYLRGFIGSNGYGPSYREIQKALGYSSVSTVATHIEGLIKAGKLRKKDRSARSLEIASETITEPQRKWLLVNVEKVGYQKTKTWLETQLEKKKQATPD